jgi:hypothetical protein
MTDTPETDPGRVATDEIRAALRSLPAAVPSATFTMRVLARLDRPRRPRRRPLPAWVAAALTVAVLVGGLWGVAAGREAWQRQQRRAALRAESEALARELAALHAEAKKQKPAPVLYLGGNEQVDVVLDLSKLPLRP